MIRKATDVKLNVLPVIIMCEHKYYYEGPCRFGKGEALYPGYDRLANEQKALSFLASVESCAPEGVTMMEPVRFTRTDDWDNDESQWEAMTPAVKNCDFAVIMTGIACDDLVVEFAERFKVPTAITPISAFSSQTDVANLRAKPINEYEAYAFYKWEDLGFQMKVLRARKVLQNLHILCVTRFGSPTSYSSLDALNSYNLITDRLGVRFRFVNVHELFDQMTPAIEGGNHSTPGRITPDLDDEDMKKVDELCDELCSNAVAVNMDREDIKNSLKFYVMVQKYLDLKDCNGFTIPCPDACSTRRLNEQRFTPCLTHSLNMENLIPSACEYDTNAVLSQQALIAVSGKCVYMGNTCPVPFENGRLSARFGTTPEQLAKLEENPGNIYMMQHSVASRRLPDPDKLQPYQINCFAHDQKFGATIRYDFDADAGQKVTLCRFSPDASKLFIGNGEIIMGGGYDTNNCSQLVYFRVKNVEDMWEKQCSAGNHLSLVYGDYTKELIALAKSLKVEPLIAE